MGQLDPAIRQNFRKLCEAKETADQAVAEVLKGLNRPDLEEALSAHPDFREAMERIKR